MYSIYNDTNMNVTLNNKLKNQGKILLDNNLKHTQNIDVSRILETCDKTVCSIRETMDQSDSKNVNVNFNTTLSKIKEKEEKYNRKLKEYTDLQNRLNEELVRKNDFYTKNQSYLGKTVVNHNTNYYINHFGYVHTYSHEAWDNDHSSCPKTAIEISSKELCKFKKVNDMNTGQPCHVAGKIIQNSETGDYAWVDLKGIKHIFSNSTFPVRHNSCKINDIKRLNNKDFNSIPQGSNMNKHNPCMKLDVNHNDYLKLKKINEELIYLAKDISKYMGNVVSKDYTINRKIQNKRHKLECYLKDLDNNRNRIEDYEKSIKTINAQEHNSSKETTAEYYMYISWSLVAILVGGITIKTLVKK